MEIIFTRSTSNNTLYEVLEKLKLLKSVYES